MLPVKICTKCPVPYFIHELMWAIHKHVSILCLYTCINFSLSKLSQINNIFKRKCIANMQCNLKSFFLVLVTQLYLYQGLMRQFLSPNLAHWLFIHWLGFFVSILQWQQNTLKLIQMIWMYPKRLLQNITKCYSKTINNQLD